MSKTGHLQLSEVLEYLEANRACAIVHPESQQEVAIDSDHKATWSVIATSEQSPSALVRQTLQAAGFETRDGELTARFGPQKGHVYKFAKVTGSFESPDAAARAALMLFQHLWHLSTDEWLWVTAMQYDDREEPKRPTVWPPAGT